jgi:lipopolysaccharide biosynthesis glycosyltransferase
MKNLLVTLANEGYVKQAKQLFSSAYWNAGWKGDYMLLSYKIPEKKLRWFRKKGILVKECKSLPGITKDPKITTMLSKFCLFKPELKKWKNIIYLDADIIVRASLDKLTKIKGFAAALDLGKIRKLKDQFRVSEKNKFLLDELKRNYNLEEKSFNSGVITFGTDIIKKDTFFKLKKLFKKYDKIRNFNDQPILNLLFYKKWTKLDLVYNSKYYFIGLPFLNNERELKVKAITIHFPGYIKPWNPVCPFYKEWKDNLDKAELINTKKPQKPKKEFTKKEIEKYSKILKRKKFLYSPILGIDRGFGLVGIFLRKYFPALYVLLKKKL